jgi:hypothetical protein
MGLGTTTITVTCPGCECHPRGTTVDSFGIGLSIILCEARHLSNIPAKAEVVDMTPEGGLIAISLAPPNIRRRHKGPDVPQPLR